MLDLQHHFGFHRLLRRFVELVRYLADFIGPMTVSRQSWPEKEVMKYMGQYFMPVNKTKKEYFTAWEIGGVAKLWEWCANHEAGVFPYLLRKSDELGGGDIADPAKVKYAGRWAGDEVYLVGDYDSSRLWDQAKKTFKNIAKELVKEYNQFIAIKERKLNH